MAKRQATDNIKTRIEAFVDEISDMIREAAMESVQEALGGAKAAAPKRRGRKPGRKPKAAAPRRKGKRAYRSEADIEQQAAQVLATVKANPGLRLGGIGKAVGLANKDVRRPMAELMEARKVRTEGERGGTRYYAAGVKAPRGRSRKA